MNNRVIIGLKDLLLSMEKTIDWIAAGYSLERIDGIKDEIKDIFTSDPRCEKLNNEYYCIFTEKGERRELLRSLFLKSKSLKEFATYMVKGGFLSYPLKHIDGLSDEEYGIQLISCIIDDSFEKME